MSGTGGLAHPCCTTEEAAPSVAIFDGWAPRTQVQPVCSYFPHATPTDSWYTSLQKTQGWGSLFRGDPWNYRAARGQPPVSAILGNVPSVPGFLSQASMATQKRE